MKKIIAYALVEGFTAESLTEEVIKLMQEEGENWQPWGNHVVVEIIEDGERFTNYTQTMVRYEE